MAPATKSKTKDKSSSRAAKEQQKILTKPSANGGNVQANVYNPFSGTFHTVETSPATSPTPQNGKFSTIDENEEHSINNTADYDSKSNNDSCSVESEDHKDKVASGPSRPEAIPGCDTEKRDKIRQKNERKHQRQKEKRAQELHERCTGFIMSRKLEVLTQQLVAMGFPAERATMALMLNEGRVEDSVSWLFEGGTEGEETTTINGGCNLKIDISDELARIVGMEKVFRCSTQEVERAIVACEGDLEKASETLKTQKQEASDAPPKLHESGNPSATTGPRKLLASAEKSVTTVQVKPVASVGIQQPRRDERDFGYPKVVASIPVSPDIRNRSLSSSRSSQSRTDRQNLQVAPQLDKRWPTLSAAPANSLSLASPLQVTSPPTVDARCGLSNGEVKTNNQAGLLRDVGYMNVMHQRSQQISTKQNSSVAGISLNMLPKVSNGWNPKGPYGIDILNAGNDSLRQNMSSMSQNASNPNGTQSFHHPVVPSSVESSTNGWGAPLCGNGTSNGACSVTATSSLGLFTGWGSSASSGSSSPLDWSMGDSMLHCDYASIDWSMESTPVRLNGLPSLKKDHRYETTYMGGNTVQPRLKGRVPGLQEGGLSMKPSGAAGEWASPFAWKDIFMLPRSFVTSSSL